MEVLALSKQHCVREFAIDLARCCHDDNCDDVLLLDLRGLSSITDYFVIATGSSDRQMRTVADNLRDLGTKYACRAVGLEGYEYAHWILVDFVDVMAHIFTRDFRQLYDLEMLWGDVPQVDWQHPETADNHK